MRDFYIYHNDREDYSHNEFKPFDLINDLVDKNRNANAKFCEPYHFLFQRGLTTCRFLDKIDEKTLPMGFRPVYGTYVDVVIEHLGGKSFRETAVEELLATPEQSCQTGILEQSQDGVEEGQDNLSQKSSVSTIFPYNTTKGTESPTTTAENWKPCAGIALRCG